MILPAWKQNHAQGLGNYQRQRLVLKTEGKVFHMEAHQLSFSKANQVLKKNIKHSPHKNAAGILIIIIIILIFCELRKQENQLCHIDSNEIPGFSQ